ncbi:protein NYNRIN-like [Schistocerca gregaria]|uniref:protein NYNRIN-like n=1 Tax=Schistocerca gregaria TaxID=7010 RepID=UPI00211E94F8|nr:protein NYNRIN-like [Schistocerca gregaria]
MVKLVSKTFVWPGMDRDCRQWTTACLCREARISWSCVGEFPDVSSCCAHVHPDVVGPMAPSNGHGYLMTMIDRYTRWPEAVPMDNILVEMLAAAFTSKWLARFGCPLRITTNGGRQFESELFMQTAKFCGYSHHKTTACHLDSNGMLERLHHTLKSALMCHWTTWTSALS